MSPPSETPSPHSKTTTLEGFLTGNHIEGILCEMELPQRHQFDSDEAYQTAKEQFRNLQDTNDSLRLGDLIPEAARDGQYRFTISVEAVPMEPEQSTE